MAHLAALTRQANSLSARASSLGTVLTLALGLAAAVGAQGNDGVDTEISAQVESFLHHYVEALERRDETEVVGLFVEDERFAWFTDGAKSYDSASDVLAGLERFADLTFETRLDDIQVLPLANTLASATTRFVTELTLPGGDTTEYGGVITFLVEKGGVVDGEPRWRIVLGHTSTAGGPPR